MAGMTFHEFSQYLGRLEGTTSRIEITKVLSELLSKLTVQDISSATYLLVGSVAPSYEGVVFNVADKMVERALAAAFEIESSEVGVLRKKAGDLGIVAFDLAEKKNNTAHESVSLQDVFGALILLSEEEGEGSQEKRIQRITDLYKQLAPDSVKYFTRIILGKLRLGFSEKTIIDALSWMETGDKSMSAKIARAYEVVPDIGTLAREVKEKGAEKATKNITPIIGIPVEPMLCQRLKSPADMIKKMGEVAVEPKFDGLRVIIHYSAKKKILKAFTRNLKEISNMFPELSEIQKHLKAHEVILDTEAVGMDAELMNFLDFQTTMQRRRKHEIESIQNRIPVTFQVFDMIYLDGESLMDTPYSKRRELMEKTIIGKNLLKVDESITTSDPAEITRLHHEYREKGLEGIIVKKLDSGYVPGRLGWRWVKMKEAEEATGKLPDTVDAVIMGYTQGEGKRAQFGIGQFLVGILDGDTVKTITKVGTGLSDAQFHELEKRLKPLVVVEKPKEYEAHKDLTPDYWVQPKVVVELAADDLTVSPKHSAGYAMRFPRLVKFRDDRSVKEVTTLKEIKKLFTLQKK